MTRQSGAEKGTTEVALRADRSASDDEDAAMAAASGDSGFDGGANPDEAPNWPDEATEAAFLSEQQSQGVGRTLPRAPRENTDATDDSETDNAPLPALDELIAKLPAQSRDTLEELFRAKFVRVVRTNKHALKK